MREINPDTKNTLLHMYLQRISITSPAERLKAVATLADPHWMILQTQNSDDNIPLHMASMQSVAGSCMNILLDSRFRNERPIAYAKNIQAAVVLQTSKDKQRCTWRWSGLPPWTTTKRLCRGRTFAGTSRARYLKSS